MAEPSWGLLDTSVVIDLNVVNPALLPDESTISAVTLAELAAGPHATPDAEERARRQDRLQWAAATWDALPFDADAARMYGRIFAAMRAAGRSSRARLADLLIASTAARPTDCHSIPATLPTSPPSDDSLRSLLSDRLWMSR